MFQVNGCVEKHLGSANKNLEQEKYPVQMKQKRTLRIVFLGPGGVWETRILLTAP